MIVILHRGDLYTLYDLLKKFDKCNQVIVLSSKEKMLNMCIDYLDDIKKMVHQFEVIEGYDSNSQIENKIYHLSQKYQINVVFAIAEFDLYRAQRINKWLGLNYIDEHLLSIFRNKVAMKDYFSRHGMRVAHYAPVKSVLDIYDFVDKYGLPVVIKEQEGGGGVGTQILRTVADIEVMAGACFRSSGFVEPALMVESYVDGRLYHVDGMCYDNKLCYLSCGEYVNGLIDDFCQSRSLGSVLLSNHSPVYAKLAAAHQALLASVSMPVAFCFHTEYFIDDNDEVILCEIACRTGGALINELNYLIRGVDMNAWLLDTLYHQRPAKVMPKNTNISGGWIVFSLGQVTAKINHIAKTCPLPSVLCYRPSVIDGQKITPTISNIQGICVAAFEGEDRQHALANYEAFVAWINDDLVLMDSL